MAKKILIGYCAHCFQAVYWEPGKNSPVNLEDLLKDIAGETITHDHRPWWRRLLGR